MITEVVGFDGGLGFDRSKPDSVSRMLLDVSRLAAMGRRPRIALRDDLAHAYAWFRDNVALPKGAAAGDAG